MTLCLNCGKLLAAPGEGRLAPSNHDQRLPIFPQAQWSARYKTNTSDVTDDVTWRRCDLCFEVALGIRMAR